MSTQDSLVQLYTKQHATSVELALQQRNSRLAIRFMQGSHTGEMASPIDRVSPIEVREVSGRFEDIGRVEQEYARRWLRPRSFDLPVYVDSFDELKTANDPKSALVESHRAAFERARDKVCVEAFFGNALIGKEGTETEAWSSFTGQVVAVDVGSTGATGLNVAKLRAARKILAKNDVDLTYEKLYIGINAEAHDDLFDEAMIVSKEYNIDAPIVNSKGIIERFMGFEFVPFEDFRVDGSGYRRLPVWVESGMHFGKWGTPTTDIMQDKTKKGYPWRVYGFDTFNATRRDPLKVVEVKISEA